MGVRNLNLNKQLARAETSQAERKAPPPICRIRASLQNPLHKFLLLCRKQNSAAKVDIAFQGLLEPRIRLKLKAERISPKIYLSLITSLGTRVRIIYVLCSILYIFFTKIGPLKPGLVQLEGRSVLYI